MGSVAERMLKSLVAYFRASPPSTSTKQNTTHSTFSVDPANTTLIMLSLYLKLEDHDIQDTSTQDFNRGPVPNATYEYASTTDFRETSVFKILQNFLQSDTKTSLDDAVWAILELIPDAPLSTEAYSARPS